MMKHKAYIFIVFESLALIFSVSHVINAYSIIYYMSSEVCGFSAGSADSAWVLDLIREMQNEAIRYLFRVFFLVFLYASIYSFFLFRAYVSGKRFFVLKLLLANVLPLAFLYTFSEDHHYIWAMIYQMIILLLGMLILRCIEANKYVKSINGVARV